MCGAVRVAAVAALLLGCGVSIGQTNSTATLGVLSANGAAHRGRLQVLHYYEGMPVNFTCARLPAGTSSRATVQISYYIDGSNLVTTTIKLQDSVVMYVKLRADHNDTLLTCTIQNKAKNDIIQMRLLLRTLIYKEGFEVNGLLVARHGGSSDLASRDVLRYEYHYMWLERMTVRLVKDTRDYGATWCTISGYNFPGAWLDHVNSRKILSSSTGVHLVNATLTMQQSGTTIACHLRRTAAGASADKELVLEITFIYYDLVPFLGGLTMANVELLWKTNEENMRIYYDNDMTYSGNGTQYLTCNSDGVTFSSSWIWFPSQVVNSGDTYPVSFRLNDDVVWSLIKCVRTPKANKSLPENIVHLWLHRWTTRHTSPLPKPAPNPIQDRESAWWVPAVASAASLAALACVALGVCVTWRRARWCSVRGAAAGASGDGIVACAHAARCPSSCGSEEPEYEVIPELPFPVSGVPASITQRPPLPLPAADLEESGGGGRYRHYDTPYEWRIFRFGARRCACGRCPVSG